MAHTLILGVTESGKTTLAKLMVADFNSREKLTIILDPYQSKEWKSNHVHKKLEPFIDDVTKSRSAFIYVDEAARYLDRYNDALWWLTTESRHLGHSTTIIAQDSVMVPRVVREQCTKTFVFTSTPEDSIKLAARYHPALGQCHLLPQFHFYAVDRFKPLRRGQIIKRTRVVLEPITDDGM